MLHLILLAFCAICGGFFGGRVRTVITVSLAFATFIYSGFLCYQFTFEKILHNDVSKLEIGFLTLNFGLDLFSVWFILLVSCLWSLASLYSFSYIKTNYPKKDDKIFQFCYSLAVFFAILFALAKDTITMFVMYELLTLSTIPLIGFKRNEEVKAGLVKYLTVLLGCSFVFLLPATIFTSIKSGGILFNEDGFISSLNLSSLGAKCLFFLFVFGIGKSAFFPFHIWLPSAMVAPTPVSGLLHAVAVVKVGAFFVLRLVVNIFGIDYLKELFSGFNLFMYIAGFTVLYASILAVFQNNLKKRLAYSTISQISYIALSLSTFTKVGVFVAMYQIFAHALSKILLFFTVGGFYTASHSSKIVEFTGMARKNPFACFAFLFATLSLCGLPFTSGFLNKGLLFYNALGAKSSFATFVFFTSAFLSFLYLIPVCYAIFKTPSQKQISNFSKIPLTFNFVFFFLILLNILLFIFSGLFFMNYVNEW
jgi:multicomponent Na+:H+ antiporter subunit D